jgi:hypothetical protein
MILLSPLEVASELLPYQVLVPQGRDRYSIRYHSSLLSIIFRVLVAVILAGVPVLMLVYGEGGRPWGKTIAVSMAVMASMFAAYSPRTDIDAGSRRVLGGYVLLNLLTIVMIRHPIRDQDSVQVRVSDHDGEHRHNPVYEVVIRRNGFFRTDIILLAVVSPASDPSPQLLQLAELIGELLKINHEEQVNTDRLKNGLPEYN